MLVSIRRVGIAVTVLLAKEYDVEVSNVTGATVIGVLGIPLEGEDGSDDGWLELPSSGLIQSYTPNLRSAVEDINNLLIS